MAEEFGGSEFFPGGFLDTSPSLSQNRNCLIVEIDARPQVSHLVTSRRDASGQFLYSYMQSGGALATTFTQTQFSNLTDHYVNFVDPPHYIALLDENNDIRYLQWDPITGLPSVVLGTPQDFGIYRVQYCGEFLEMIADDGISIYRLTVTSGDSLILTLNRTESIRNTPIRLSNGHPFPFDGTNLYIEKLIGIGDIARRIPQLETGFGGVAIPAVGNLRIDNSDKRFSFLSYQSWNYRNVTIRTGRISNGIDTYPIIYRGSTERVESDLDEIIVTFKDLSSLFNKSIQTNSYAGGGGGYAGDESVDGKLKPLSLGLVRNVIPLLIDSDNYIYQLHDGPVGLIFDVREGGIARTNIADIQNRAENDLTEWIPTQSDVDNSVYMTDVSSGMFRLANPPDGIITASVQGETGIPSNSSASRIVQYILETYLPEISLDLSSFDECHTDRPWTQGIYIENNISIIEVIDKFIKPLRIFLTINNQNQAVIRRVKAREHAYIITKFDEDSRVVSRQNNKVASTYRIAYFNSHSILKETDILPGATQIHRDDLIRGPRYQTENVTDSGTTRLPLVRSAKQQTIETQIYTDTSTVNQAKINSLQDYGMPNLLNVTVYNYDFSIQLGDSVIISHGAANLNNLRYGIVVGIVEHDPAGPLEGYTDLTLWI